MSSGLSIFGQRVQSLPRAGEKKNYFFPDNKLSALSKLKGFEDDSFSVAHTAQTVQCFFEKAENIVEKGENAGYQHFFAIVVEN